MIKQKCLAHAKSEEHVFFKIKCANKKKFGNLEKTFYFVKIKHILLVSYYKQEKWLFKNI